jgi:hypothetical protein
MLLTSDSLWSTRILQVRVERRSPPPSYRPLPTAYCLVPPALPFCNEESLLTPFIIINIMERQL